MALRSNASLQAVPTCEAEKILVMAGHEGGIVAFGRDLEEAFAALMREWKKVKRLRSSEGTAAAPHY